MASLGVGSVLQLFDFRMIFSENRYALFGDHALGDDCIAQEGGRHGKESNCIQAEERFRDGDRS